MAKNRILKQISYFTKSGNGVKRLKECKEIARALYYKQNGLTPIVEIISGGVYYAACIDEKTGKTVFFGMGTSVKGKMIEFFPFWEEEKGAENKHLFCPVSVLDALSPTENATAKKWREQNRFRREHEKILNDCSHIQVNSPHDCLDGEIYDEGTISIVLERNQDKWVDKAKRIAFYHGEILKSAFSPL